MASVTNNETIEQCVEEIKSGSKAATKLYRTSDPRDIAGLHRGALESHYNRKYTEDEIVQGFRSKHPNEEFVVACIDDGERTAFLSYCLRPNKVCFIGNLYVVPAWRNRGQARLFLSELKAQFTRLELTVDPSNAAAMCLYISEGFKPSSGAIDEAGRIKLFVDLI